MKKTILVIMLFALLLSGCGINNQQDATAAEGVPETTAAGSTPETTQPQLQETVTLPAATEPQKETVPPSPLMAVLSVDDLKTATYDYPDYSQRHYKLTEVDYFTLSDNSPYFGDIIYTGSISDGYTLLSSLGEDKLEKKYTGFKYFGNGITAAYTVKGSASPRCELVNVNTGEILFQDVSVGWVEPISNRYYYVVYVTGKTVLNKECVLSMDNDYTTHIYKDTSGKIKYAGYVRVYDSFSKKFLDYIHLTQCSGLYMCGNTFYTADSQYSQVQQLFFENGTNITPEKTLYATGDLFLEWNKEKDTVTAFDCNLFEITTFNHAAPIYEATSDSKNNQKFSDQYLSFYTAQGKVGVMDFRENVVLSAEYHDISYHYGDYFVLSDSTDSKSYGVVRSDGKTVVPFNHYDFLINPLDGVIGFSYTDYGYYLPGFGRFSAPDHYHSGLIMRRESDDAILVFDEFWHLHLKSPGYVGSYLVYSSNHDGIYDIFHGRKIFNENFRYAYSTSEYIYICINGIWTCYKLEY